MRQKPLVSAVIPTRKRPAGLQRALASVFAQEKIGDDFDLEVIVVYDNPADVPSEIRAQFPRVRYMKQEGRGPSAARNVGIKAAGGRYVAFLDDDDVWLPHRLKVQVPVLESHPDVAVLYGQASVSGDAQLDAWPDTAPSGRVFEAFLTLMDDFIATDTLLIRREAFATAGYFDESLPTDEHYDLCLRLAFHFAFLFVPGPVAHGHFSMTEGLWHGSILNGAFERTLPRVIEKALALLPDTAEYESLKRRARVEVVSTLARHRWEHQGAARAGEYLLTALRAQPWMLNELAILENLHRVARELALASETPLIAVRKYWGEIKIAVGDQTTEEPSVMQRLLADLLIEAAFAMGSRRSYRKAASAAMSAFFHHPARLRRAAFFTRLFRAISSTFARDYFYPRNASPS